MTKTNPIPHEQLPEAAAKMLDLIMDLQGQIWAVERLALATAGLAARAAPNPLAFADELRRLTVDPLSYAEPNGPTDVARKSLEGLLAQVENFAAAAGPG